MTEGRVCSCGHDEAAHRDGRGDWTSCACGCLGFQPPPSGRVQSDDLADDLAREMALYASITPNWSFGQMARQTLRVLRLSGYEVVREARDV